MKRDHAAAGGCRKTNRKRHKRKQKTKKKKKNRESEKSCSEKRAKPNNLHCKAAKVSQKNQPPKLTETTKRKK